MYTVKQLSGLAGVSVRTLHYYDEIGLLHPSKVGANGYRYYDEAALLRLQQILFYREIGLELAQIKDVLDSPDFDLLTALDSHRAVLTQKINRLQNLIATVDSTIRHVRGEREMSKKRLFEAFSEEKQKEYERMARLQYDPQLVNDSIKRWNGYTKDRQKEILAEAGHIYNDMVALMQAGLSPQSPKAQAAVERWRQNIRHFYEPTLEIMRGLAHAYNSDPAFMATFSSFHPDLAPYLEQAIVEFVDRLETDEIARMLAEDEEGSADQRQ